MAMIDAFTSSLPPTHKGHTQSIDLPGAGGRPSHTFQSTEDYVHPDAVCLHMQT